MTLVVCRLSGSRATEISVTVTRKLPFSWLSWLVMPCDRLKLRMTLMLLGRCCWNLLICVLRLCRMVKTDRFLPTPVAMKVV